MPTLHATPRSPSTAVAVRPEIAPLAGLRTSETNDPARPVIPDHADLPASLSVGETWTGTSTAGRPVRVTAERNDDPGAAVFYTVRYHVRADGSGHPTRYTPSWDRACALLTRFLVDVTDPAGLRPASPPAPARSA